MVEWGIFESYEGFFLFLTVSLCEIFRPVPEYLIKGCLACMAFFHLIFPCTNIVLRLGPHKFSNGPFLSKSIYFTKPFIRTFTETLIITVD